MILGWAIIATLAALSGFYFWAAERSDKRDLDQLLTRSEAERLQLRAAYQRYRAEAPQRRGQPTARTPQDPRLRLLPGEPDSKNLRGL